MGFCSLYFVFDVYSPVSLFVPVAYVFQPTCFSLEHRQMPPHLSSLQRKGNELALSLLLTPGRLSHPAYLTSSLCSCSGALLRLLLPLPKGVERGTDISVDIPTTWFLSLSAADHGDGWCFRAANASTTLGFWVLCWAGRMPAQGCNARHGNAASFGVKMLSRRSGIPFFLYFL